MAGEIIDGKRTFIQRENRRTFELPDRHTAELKDFGEGVGQWISLRTTLEGGLYTVDRLQELDDRVIVHVGAMVAETGPPGVGEGPFAPIRGYPFMDD